MKNIKVVYLREGVVDEVFKSATKFCQTHGLNRNFISMIVGQPGYRRGQPMKIARAGTGGYRLYTWIDNNWMDASLADDLGIIK